MKSLVERLTRKVDPEPGTVVMYLDDVPGGPIVTGANEEEAFAKMEKAMVIYREVTKLLISPN